MEDIIITALALAAGLIFKLIEKKLKSAKTFGDVVSESPFVEQAVELDDEPDENLSFEPVAEPVVIQEAPRIVTPAVTKAPVVMEEPKPEKEKIDPKKLVIYSEIMKPKYLE